MARSQGQRASTAVRSGKPKQTRIDVIQELLAKSTNQQENGNEEADLLIILKLLDQLIEIEKDFEPQLPSRKGKFDKFMSWVTEHGLDTSRIEVVAVDEEKDEYGLCCKRFNIKENELIMEIPRKLMLTNEMEEYKDSSFESFAKSDLMMKTMPNVRLAMTLIHEFSKRDSFWKPYIDILPSKYTNHPLYMDADDILALKPSPTFVEAIKMVKSVTRQYCYFYTQMITTKSSASQLNFRKCFTFNLYRWAVVTTMTRQNLIPAKDGTTKDASTSGSSFNTLSVNALIPVWDMCNHDHGQFSTDFNPETNSALCYAMKSFAIGSEISIFYGPRSNGEFLIHNGFVFSNDNSYHYLPIKLGISKNDPLFTLKSNLCNKCGLHEVGTFNLKPKNRGMDPKMRMFLRIFHADKDQLECCLREEDPITSLKDECSEKWTSIDTKVDTFIKTRAMILDKSYDSYFNNETTSLCKEGSIQWKLIESERKILKSYYA